MDKKKIMLIVGGIAFAVALVVGALLTRGDTGAGDSASESAAVSAEASGTAGDSSATSTATGEVAAGSVQDPSGAVPPATRERDAVTMAPASGGDPAAAGSKLATVTVPPAQTLAMILPSLGAAGDTFKVAFQPYGIGPERAGGKTLVIRVDSALRGNRNTSSLAIASGTNVVAFATPAQLDIVNEGGSYSGTLVLVPTGSAFSLELTDAAPAAR